MKKIILVNGPPRSGKDTVGKICTELVPDCRTVKMSRPLKCGAAALFYALHEGIDILHPALQDDEYYEELKDDPLVRFFGKTPREIFISLSEDYLKPMFGKDFFGNLLAARIDKMPEEFIVVTDSGFAEEVEPLVERFGKENTNVISMCRLLSDFEGDSRSYLKLKDINTKFISNNGTESDLRWRIHGLLSSINWPCTSL